MTSLGLLGLAAVVAGVGFHDGLQLPDSSAKLSDDDAQRRPRVAKEQNEEDDRKNKHLSEKCTCTLC